MIELFAAATPNGIKIAVALEWLDLPYEVTAISLRGDAPRPPMFTAASPLGKIPAIHDTDTGVEMSESGAILLYLAEKAGSSLLPPSGPERAAVLQWHFIASATIGPAFGQAHHYLHFQKGKAPYAEERSVAEVQRYYSVLEDRLSETDYLAGTAPSIADIALWPWIIRFSWQGVDLNDYPGVARWYRTMSAIPACVAGYRKLQDSPDIPMPA